MTQQTSEAPLYADTASRPSVGLIGWRGMVGSVLMQRMVEENDFAKINPVFFSTSNAGGPVPELPGVDTSETLQDAHDLETLAKLPVLLYTQGGEYTNEVYPKLRATGWPATWMDASSPLRMEVEPTIVSGPVDRSRID